METGRRGELFAYLAIIAVNLLVLPNWFSPGRFELPMRLFFIAASVAVIAFCAWRVSGILGVSPFTKRKHPQFAPYAPDEDEDEDEDAAVRGVDDADRGAGDGSGVSQRAADREGATRRRRGARSFGQAEAFREYDPYDEAPDAPEVRDASDDQLRLDAEQPPPTAEQPPPTAGQPPPTAGQPPPHAEQPPPGPQQRP